MVMGGFFFVLVFILPRILVGLGIAMGMEINPEYGTIENMK